MTTVSKTRLAAERARERDIYSYYPVSLHIPTSTDAPLSTGHRPQRRFPSSDSVLTALAQLGALRLHASRCLISLIDSQSQIILAEATPTLPLRTHGPRDDHAHDLWLGSVIVRRQGGLCETVLSSRDPVVINDLETDDRFKDCAFVQGPPHARFYAGVPLKSASGRTLGVYSIIDDHPRNGLDGDQLLYMQDAAATVVSYLAASRAQDTNSKAEQMVRGLTSFVTGAPDLQNSDELDVPRQPEDPSNTSPLPSRPHASQSTPSDQSTEQGDDDDPISLQDQILPPGSKRMFSRAANIMRESCNLQGVIFFDASIANSNQPDMSPPNSPTKDSDTDYLVSSSAADDSSESNPSSDSTGTALTTCKILGFADAGRSSRDGNSPRRDYLGLSEAALRRLLNRHPDGKIFHIPRGDFDKPTRRRKGKPKGKTAIDVIVDVANNARSAAIIPLWDYERQRWFAGCLCWTSTPSRLLAYGSDLLYLRVFGHSVMSELSRLESIAVDHAKTTFIESMSHELRSPLHGILGGVEYLQNTSLDAFHINILSSISMCGRTLLDTVSNVLEYSKINEITGPKNASPSGMRRQRLMSNSLPPPSVDICQLTEETVEAIAAGQSYNLISPQDYNEDDYFSESISPRSPRPEKPLRKAVRIILDMPHRSSWSYSIQPGIWRRILMNIFGNSMKFTFDGFVRVSLRAVEVDDEYSEITLSVMDSGVGMSPGYVQEGLFKPFSQETSFSSGTGLGMSIVKRLVQSLDGEISVQSQSKAGTEVKIRMILQKGIRFSSNRELESTVATRAKEMPVALVMEEVPQNDGSLSLYALSERYFHASLSSTLEAWFGVTVTNTDDISSSSSQLILYPGPSFNASFQQRSQVGVSVVVALDAIEATTLRNDPRVTQGQIEVVTQPCGPIKLAKILDRYISRLDTDGTTPPLKPDITRTHSPALDFELGTVSLPFNLRPPIKVKSQATLPETHSITRISSNELPQHHSSPDSYPTPMTAVHTPAPLDTERSPTPTQSGADNEPPSASSSTHEQRKQSIQCDAPPPPSLPTASTAPPPKDILIVDDNPLNLRLLSAFLRKNNLPHASANNGLEALNLFKEDPKRWAAVLMDLSMPVMDGVSATREIRAWERKCADEKVRDERDRMGSQAGEALNAVQEWKRRDVVREETGKGGEVEMDEAERGVVQGRSEDEGVDGAADVPEMVVSPVDEIVPPPPAPPMSLENEEEKQQQQTPVAATAATIATAPSPSLLRDGVQIIVITGLGSATARFEATSAGADVFMTKPIQFTALMQTLKERF